MHISLFRAIATSLLLIGTVTACEDDPYDQDYLKDASTSGTGGASGSKAGTGGGASGTTAAGASGTAAGASGTAAGASGSAGTSAGSGGSAGGIPDAGMADDAG